MIVIKNRVSLDKTLAEPVYQQLSNGISDMIRQGLLQPGEALPSSRKLAEAFEIHRKTVIAAFDELQAMGWADSLPRKGLFVSAQLPVTKPRSMAAAKTMTVYPSQTAYGVERKQYPVRKRQWQRQAVEFCVGRCDPLFCRTYQAGPKRRPGFQRRACPVGQR